MRAALRGARLVAASDLTLLECHRVLLRAVTLGEIEEGAAADRQGELNAAADRWHLWHVSSEIMDLASRPFPAEPVRTLDAVHLASPLAVRSIVPAVEMLSLDARIRKAGQQLGFRLRPQ